MVDFINSNMNNRDPFSLCLKTNDKTTFSMNNYQVLRIGLEDFWIDIFMDVRSKKT